MYQSRNSRVLDNYSDPSLPNYRPEWWRRSVEHWKKTLDWTGFLDDLSFKNEYLTKVASEFEEDRKSRLQAIDPEPFFKDSVDDHASIFTQFELSEDAPESIVENQDNIDLQGSDLWQWSVSPLKAFFRDGAVLLGADIDRDVTQGPRRPRLLYVPIRDVYWPEYRKVGNTTVWSRVSIRRSFNAVSSQDGSLLLLSEFYVYELDELGRCFLTVWREAEEGDLWQNSESIPLFAANNEPLMRLPFSDRLSVIGDIDMDLDRLIMSPFADVLSLGIQHYNLSSEINTIRRKTACPTPIRYWVNGVPQNPPPFYAGSGRCQDYAAGSEVVYLELNGESLPELRQGLMDLEEKIKARDNKLFHSGAAMSATEAEIENQKAKVGMPLFKALIESAFQDAFDIWETLANPDRDEEVGGIIIDQTALDAPPNPQDILPYLQAIDRGFAPAVVQSALIRRGLFTKEDFEEAGESEMIPLNSQEPIV